MCLLCALMPYFTETFNVPLFSMPCSDVLAVYSQHDAALLHGRTVVLHSGFDSTIVSQVYGGVTLGNSLVTGPIGGAHVSVRMCPCAVHASHYVSPLY